ANNAIINSWAGKYDWDDSFAADSYDIYLGTSGAFFNTTVSEWTTTPGDGVRLWRVVAKNANGSTNGPQWQYTKDTVVPTASLVPSTPTQGASTWDFVVTYTDA